MKVSFFLCTTIFLSSILVLIIYLNQKTLVFGNILDFLWWFCNLLDFVLQSSDIQTFLRDLKSDDQSGLVQMIRSHACIHSLSSIQEYYTLYLIQYVHTNCLEVPNSNCLQELLDKNGWSACRKTRAYYTYARSMQFTLLYLQIALSGREGNTTTYLNTSPKPIEISNHASSHT